MSDDSQRNDDGRLDVLRALHHRRTGAHSADTIRNVFLASRDYTQAEVNLWLADLKRYGFAEPVFTGLTDSTEAWQITAAGQTRIERGGHRS